jgi:hypothetical protein
VGEEGWEGKGRDYTRDHRYKEMLGRTSFLEVYFRNSKFMARNPVYQGMNFGVEIVLKRTFQIESICISEGQFYVKSAKIAGKTPIAA